MIRSPFSNIACTLPAACAELGWFTLAAQMTKQNKPATTLQFEFMLKIVLPRLNAPDDTNARQNFSVCVLSAVGYRRNDAEADKSGARRIGSQD
jgi:hypothetical protein